MKPGEQNSSNNKKQWWRRINLEFYYMEKVGPRYYLRVTPFFWIMIILSLVFFFGFLLYQKYQADRRYNLTTLPAQAPAPTQSSPTPVHPASKQTPSSTK